LVIKKADRKILPAIQPLSNSMRTDTNLTNFAVISEQNANGSETYLLKKNGSICTCPFRNPVILPHPSIQGQMVIQNPVCSEACQFFEVYEKKDNTVVLDLICTNRPITALIEKEKKSDNTSPKDSNLIIL